MGIGRILIGKIKIMKDMCTLCTSDLNHSLSLHKAGKLSGGGSIMAPF